MGDMKIDLKKQKTSQRNNQLYNVYAESSLMNLQFKEELTVSGSIFLK